MGVNGGLYVAAYCIFFPPVLRRPSTICKQKPIFLARFPFIVSGKSDTFGHCRVKAAHSTRDPTIDLMRSPTVKQTAAGDKHW